MVKKMNKEASQRWHFKFKIKERYGIFCNRDVYFYIVDNIRSGMSIFIEKQSNTRSLHKVLIPLSVLSEQSELKVSSKDGYVEVYVVYDKLRGELITALPWKNTQAEFLTDYHNNHLYVRC